MSDKKELQKAVEELKKSRNNIDKRVTEAAKKVNQTRQEQKA